MAKPTIVTRATKGSALTWTEGDANFTNLQNATLTIAPGAGAGRTAKTLSGTASTSATQAKFGAKSIQFSGSNNVTAMNSTDFQFGTMGWTVEFWVYIDSGSSGTRYLIDMRDASSSDSALSIYLDSSRNVIVQADTTTLITSGSALANSTWYHIAVDKLSGGSGTRLYINGTQSGSSYTSFYSYNSSARFRLGSSQSTSDYFTGFIDEIRVSKFQSDITSRYSSNFTEPSAAFTNDADTVLLIHADGTSIEDDATPASIVLDLNDTFSIGAGSGISLAFDAGANSLVIDTAAGGGTTLSSLSDVSVGGATNGQVLTYNSTGMNWTASTPSSPSLALDDLTNVNAATPTDGQVLSYNNGTMNWVASTPSTGTVTSVGGTGTVSGLTLTGTVTSTGDLTLGGTLSLVSPGAIGSTTASTGKFTSLEFKNPLEPIYDLGTTGGTVAPDPGNGSVQKITLNSALTLNAFTNPTAGESLTLIIYGGTAYTSITSTMKFAGGIKTLTATAGCIDIVSIYYDGTTYFASLGKGFA